MIHSMRGIAWARNAKTAHTEITIDSKAEGLLAIFPQRSAPTEDVVIVVAINYSPLSHVVYFSAAFATDLKACSRGACNNPGTAITHGHACGSSG